MSQGGMPIYTVRGAPPRPLPSDESRRSSWRMAVLLVIVMVAWMLILFLVAAIVSPLDANIEVPTEVGLGVIVTPADRWYSAAEVWDVGSDALSLQKSGAYVAFFVESYDGTNRDLLDEMLQMLEPDFESFRALPAGDTTVAGDVPALRVFFSGVSEHWGAENEVVVATSAGVGIVMLATASAGQLDQVQGDLETMLETMVVPR